MEWTLAVAGPCRGLNAKGHTTGGASQQADTSWRGKLRKSQPSWHGERVSQRLPPGFTTATLRTSVQLSGRRAPDLACDR
jgi:hypothetical protein